MKAVMCPMARDMLELKDTVLLANIESLMA